MGRKEMGEEEMEKWRERGEEGSKSEIMRNGERKGKVDDFDFSPFLPKK